MTSQVECYAGSSYPEKPRVVVWEDQRFPVDTIIDQRREPDGIGFRVLCKPDKLIFDLYYNLDTDTWEVRLLGSSPRE